MNDATSQPSARPRLSGGAKFLVDFGPLAVFFIAYFLGERLTGLVGNLAGAQWCLREGAEMYLAITVFLPTYAAAFGYSAWKEKRIAPMLMVSGVIIGVLGVLTLVLQNKTFFYMKPTIIYVLFGSVLYAGLFLKRNYLKIVFDDALALPDDIWRTLTARYAAFFLVLAFANELAWRWLTRDCGLDAVDASAVGGQWGWLLRDCAAEKGAPCAGEAAWVNLKIFGFTGANIIFIATQMPLIIKHQPDDEPAHKAD